MKYKIGDKVECNGNYDSRIIGIYDYNLKRMKETMRWAMLEMIKNPPKGFEEVIDITRAFVITEQGNYFLKDCATI